MFGRKRKSKSKTRWSSIRKKAPKVPDITCPAIDDVQKRLGNIADRGKKLTAREYHLINNKLERLRRANEMLRDSGIYWHDVCKDLIVKKKY
jgi:hypothetical protein